MAKNIEQYLEELKEIADKMNREDISLDEAVALYKKGSETAKKVEAMLDGYEKELEIIEEGDQ